MRLRKNYLALVVSFLALVAVSGCDSEAPETPTEDLVSNFVDYCYEPGVNVAELSVNARLVFDTLNLPLANGGLNKLVMGIDSASPFGNGPFLEFNFPEILNESIDPGIAMQRGWKVTVRNVRADKCTTCYTNDGLARVILLSGSIEDVVFEYDPQDTLGLYIETSAIEN